jgi:pimeloyl-ACP methyl ester carboxylesterase
VLASLHAMRTAAARIPGAQLTVLAGSHFLPLEFPDELTDGLRALVRRTGLPDDLSPSAAG